MTSITLAELTSLTLALVALAALIISPAVTLKVATRQVLTPVRQRWVDTLRELMSDYLSECQREIVQFEGNGSLAREDVNAITLKKLLYLEKQLELLLDPTDELHNELNKAVADINESVLHGVANFLDFGASLQKATRLCQSIIGTELRRINEGKL